ncbi:uncharacterized protein LOC131362631, partial [Hemibagrus wyckioides]|uniref:uncharacterized protein LOC131362631 n=1 Tax=Hemibagrus wyckioides TaxID=337641 RepID=UPI00266B95A9
MAFTSPIDKAFARVRSRSSCSSNAVTEFCNRSTKSSSCYISPGTTIAVQHALHLLHNEIIASQGTSGAQMGHDDLGCISAIDWSKFGKPEPSQRGEWVTTRRHSRKAKANAKARPWEHHSSPLHMSNRFALLSEEPAEKPERALGIGDSILRHVKLARPLGAPEAQVRCIPGARVPDIAGNLRVLGKHRFSKIVFHVGANDIHLCQSEVTKSNVVEVCKLAKAMSDAVVCSGPIPMRRGDVAYSRLWSLNCWMSRWCSENNVSFIDNWSSFEGKAGLLGRDSVHPTREGAAL